MNKKFVFHSNFHFSSHFSKNDGQNYNSATDPIASYAYPFQGNFYVASTINAPTTLVYQMHVNNVYANSISSTQVSMQSAVINTLHCNLIVAPVSGTAIYQKSITRPALIPYTAAIIFDNITIKNLNTQSFSARVGNIQHIDATNLFTPDRLFNTNISASTLLGLHSAAVVPDFYLLMSKKASTVHQHNASDIILFDNVTLSEETSGFESAFSTKSLKFHTHPVCDIIDCSAYNTISASINNKSNLIHTHAVSSINGLDEMITQHTPLLHELSASVSTKVPIDHTHTISYINDSHFTKLVEDLSASAYRDDGGISSYNLQDIVSNRVKQTLVDHYHSVFQIKDLYNYVAGITALKESIKSIALSGHTHYASEFTDQIYSLSSHLLQLSAKIDIIFEKFNAYNDLIPLSEEQKNNCFRLNELFYRKYELTRLNPIIFNKNVAVDMLSTQHVVLEGSTIVDDFFVPTLTSRYFQTTTLYTDNVSSDSSFIVNLSTDSLSVNMFNVDTLSALSGITQSLSDTSRADMTDFFTTNTTVDYLLVDYTYVMDLLAYEHKYTGIGGQIFRKLSLNPADPTYKYRLVAQDQFTFGLFPVGIPGRRYVNGVLSGSIGY